jgi:hypothetical protein
VIVPRFPVPLADTLRQEFPRLRATYEDPVDQGFKFATHDRACLTMDPSLMKLNSSTEFGFFVNLIRAAMEFMEEEEFLSTRMSYDMVKLVARVQEELNSERLGRKQVEKELEEVRTELNELKIRYDERSKGSEQTLNINLRSDDK